MTKQEAEKLLDAYVAELSGDFTDTDDRDALREKIVDGLAGPSAPSGSAGQGLLPDEWHLFHNLWTKAVGTPDYDKEQWIKLEGILVRFGSAGQVEKCPSCGSENRGFCTLVTGVEHLHNGLDSECCKNTWHISALPSRAGREPEGRAESAVEPRSYIGSDEERAKLERKALGDFGEPVVSASPAPLARKDWIPCPICGSEYDGKFCHACRNEQPVSPSPATQCVHCSEEIRESEQGWRAEHGSVICPENPTGNSHEPVAAQPVAANPPVNWQDLYQRTEDALLALRIELGGKDFKTNALDHINGQGWAEVLNDDHAEQLTMEAYERRRRSGGFRPWAELDGRSHKSYMSMTKAVMAAQRYRLGCEPPAPLPAPPSEADPTTCNCKEMGITYITP